MMTKIEASSHASYVGRVIALSFHLVLLHESCMVIPGGNESRLR